MKHPRALLQTEAFHAGDASLLLFALGTGETPGFVANDWLQNNEAADCERGSGPPGRDSSTTFRPVAVQRPAPTLKMAKLEHASQFLDSGSKTVFVEAD